MSPGLSLGRGVSLLRSPCLPCTPIPHSVLHITARRTVPGEKAKFIWLSSRSMMRSPRPPSSLTVTLAPAAPWPGASLPVFPKTGSFSSSRSQLRCHHLQVASLMQQLNYSPTHYPSTLIPNFSHSIYCFLIFYAFLPFRKLCVPCIIQQLLTLCYTCCLCVCVCLCLSTSI